MCRAARLSVARPLTAAKLSVELMLAQARGTNLLVNSVIWVLDPHSWRQGASNLVTFA
jgi:hypothetical protein